MSASGSDGWPTQPPEEPPVGVPSGEPERGREEADLERQLAALQEAERLLRLQIAHERTRRQARRAIDREEALNPPEAAGRRIRLTPASAFRIEAVRWVWAGRIPLGEITLVPGREGVGKSTFLAWLAARITRGELPGEFDGTKRAVLYAATEDSWGRTITPRMLAAGADMDLVFRVDVEVVEGQVGKLILPLDLRELATRAREVEAGALMCDPIISVLSDRVNTFKAQELRGALEPLRAFADTSGTAVAGLVHFNKGKDNDVLTAVSGSRAWTEVARAVVAIARDPDADEYTCVVSQVKNNLGRLDLPHLAYTIRSTAVETHDGRETDVGRLHWVSQEYERGVEELLAPPKREKTTPVLEDVVEVVREVWEETGAAVPTKAVTDRLGGRYTLANLRQALVRAVNRDKTLRKVGYGLYAPSAEPVIHRMCPSCGKTPILVDENFCHRCRKALDKEDRASRLGDTLL